MGREKELEDDNEKENKLEDLDVEDAAADQVA